GDRLTRILGTARRAGTPAVRPAARGAVRTRRYRASCSAWLPWLRLNRATSIPASTRDLIRSYESVAGPSVQTIFARRMVRAYGLPPSRHVASGDDPQALG